VTSFTLELLRAEGKGRVRARLEALVNADVIGLAGAQKVYREAFGDRLVAVKERRGFWARLRGWWAR
jgi:hypothetical protein